MEPLDEALQSICDLTPEAREPLAQAFRPRTVGAGERLKAFDEERHELYFVESGLLRFAELTPEAEEVTRAFAPEGTLLGAWAAWKAGPDTWYSVEALEPSVVLSVAWDRLEELYRQHPPLERWGRTLVEGILRQKDQRTRSLQTLSAAQRYARFLEDHGGWAHRVRQVHLASYLGMTPVTLSRLRSRLNKR